MKIRIYLIILPVILFTVFAISGIEDISALKSKGTTLTEIGSNKVCGIELCTSPQSISEKIDIFLAQNDSTFPDIAFQQSFDLGRRVTLPDELNNSVSEGPLSTQENNNEIDQRNYREKEFPDFLSTLRDNPNDVLIEDAQELAEKYKAYLKSEILILLDDVENMEYEKVKNKINHLKELLDSYDPIQTDEFKNIDKNNN